MLKKSTAAKVIFAIAVLAMAIFGVVLFGLARSTDNGPLSTAPLFTFAAAGDFGANDNTKAVLKEIVRNNADFTVALGDLSYGKVSEQEWCGMLHGILGKDHPVELVAGNHDDKEGSTDDTFRQCLPNKMAGMTGEYGAQYAFTYKNAARFINIAPGLTVDDMTYQYKPGSAEYTWLVDQIESAHANGIPWTIVGMHEVCITMGEKSCEINPSLFSLLIEKKVDLILQGHEHGYIRSKQLASRTACPPDETGSIQNICVADSDNAFRKGQGTVVAINGSGGAEIRAVNLESPDKPYFADWHGANADPAYGPFIVSVWADKLEARFMSSAGEQKDAFTITRYDTH